jgi:outer membrane biosynthesis protein TonB
MRGFTPSVVVSVLVHLAVVAFFLLRPPQPPPEIGTAVVPISIVNRGPPAAPTPAPTPQLEDEAPVETPEAEDEAPPPPPAPTPPAPAPKPTPTPPKPNVSKPVQKPTPPAPPKKSERESNAFLDSLIASNSKKGGPPKKTSQGEAKTPQGAPTQGAIAGDPSELAGLARKMGEYWDLNCEVAGTRTAVVKVRITINGDGRLATPPVVLNPSGNSVFADAQGTALRALKRGEPYSLTEVPPKWRNQAITLNFRAADVCRNR